MDLVWVTRVTPSPFELTVHLLTRLYSIPLLLELLLSIHSSWGGWKSGQHRQKQSSHAMRSSPGCWPWHQLRFLSYHAINAMPMEQQPGKSGRGQGNRKHSPSFLLTDTCHCEPHTPHHCTCKALGSAWCPASCLVPSPKHEDIAWQPWECWSHQQNFPVEAGFSPSKWMLQWLGRKQDWSSQFILHLWRKALYKCPKLKAWLLFSFQRDFWMHYNKKLILHEKQFKDQKFISLLMHIFLCWCCTDVYITLH